MKVNRGYVGQFCKSREGHPRALAEASSAVDLNEGGMNDAFVTEPDGFSYVFVSISLQSEGRGYDWSVARTRAFRDGHAPRFPRLSNCSARPWPNYPRARHLDSPRLGPCRASRHRLVPPPEVVDPRTRFTSRRAGFRTPPLSRSTASACRGRGASSSPGVPSAHLPGDKTTEAVDSCPAHYRANLMATWTGSGSEELSVSVCEEPS